MAHFAKPKIFLGLLKKARPFLGLASLVSFCIALFFALFNSPLDYQQGETVRLMYVHVPASWMAVGVYTMMAISSAVGFIWKHPLSEIMAKAAAPLGLLFTSLSLVTGSLWGKPMWGTFWAWDARLTSVLVLFFIYCGYILLVNSYEDPQKGLKRGAILLLFGMINIPIIKWSVVWWHTLHQPASLTKLAAPSMHESFMIPLLIMASAYGLFFLYLLSYRLESELMRARLRVLDVKKKALERKGASL